VSVRRDLSRGAQKSGTAFISQRVFTKSIPAQIRQRILYISNNEGHVDGFVPELTFAERLYKHFT